MLSKITKLPMFKWFYCWRNVALLRLVEMFDTYWVILTRH